MFPDAFLELVIRCQHILCTEPAARATNATGFNLSGRILLVSKLEEGNADW